MCFVSPSFSSRAPSLRKNRKSAACSREHTDDDTAPTPPAATAGKRFVLKTCGSPTWDSQNILYMHAPEYNANLKMAQDNFEGNLCLAATGSVNEDVIETAICDGNDKYQAWQLKVIEELPQHLDDEYGGH